MQTIKNNIAKNPKLYGGAVGVAVTGAAVAVGAGVLASQIKALNAVSDDEISKRKSVENGAYVMAGVGAGAAGLAVIGGILIMAGVMSKMKFMQ